MKPDVYIQTRSPFDKGVQFSSLFKLYTCSLLMKGNQDWVWSSPLARMKTYNVLIEKKYIHKEI